MAEVGAGPHKNPISRLQEVCQQWKFPLPAYREAQGSFSEFGTEVGRDPLQQRPHQED